MKTKKLFSLIILAVFVASIFSVNASALANTPGTGDFVYALNSNVHYGSEIIPYSATVTDIPNTKKVEIPEKVTFDGIEYTVTDLDLDGWYSVTAGGRTTVKHKYTNVEEIVLPDTIYNITELSDIPNLTKLNLPPNAILGRETDYDDYIIKYHNRGFNDYVHLPYLENFPKLTLSVSPDSKYYSYKNNMLLSKDGKTLYLSLNRNTDITIPDGVEEILDYGGVGFSHVKNVRLPDTLKYFGGGDWDSLTKIALPNGLEEIRALLGKSKIKDITLPDSLKKIGWGVFKNSKLTKIVISDSVKEIGGKAFAGSKLKSVKFGKSVKFINEKAFYNCKNLKSVTIPESVVRIESDAFRDCKNLKSVKILSSNIQYIRHNAFQDCKKLKAVTINGAEKIAVCAFDNCKKLSKITINNKENAPKLFDTYIGGFKNSKKGIKFVVKNNKVAKELKKQLNRKKIKCNLKDAKIIVGKKVIYKINSK